MPETDLSDYEVEFSANSGLWSWEVSTPDGRTISSDLLSVQRDALAAIKRDQRRETIDGEELSQRVAERAKG